MTLETAPYGRPAASLLLAFAGDAPAAGALGPALLELDARLPDAPRSLLWPVTVPVPEAAARGASCCIDYAADRGDRAALERSIAEVRALHADCAIVFTATGWAADAPAFIAYLAGIGHRAGIESEFAGGLLSEAFRDPAPIDERERHLWLLVRLGLAAPRAPSQRSALAAGSAVDDRAVGEEAAETGSVFHDEGVRTCGH